MITNTMLIKLKERDNESIKKAKSVLLSMEGKVKSLKELQVKEDIRRSESSFDLLIVTRFASAEDWEEYLNDPVHKEVSEYISAVLEASASVYCED